MRQGIAWRLHRVIGGWPPIVVGATSGSGTRVVQAVLARAGVFMGVRLNEAGDAMDFEPILDELINPVLAVTRSLDYRAEKPSRAAAPHRLAPV